MLAGNPLRIEQSKRSGLCWDREPRVQDLSRCLGRIDGNRYRPLRSPCRRVLRLQLGSGESGWSTSDHQTELQREAKYKRKTGGFGEDTFHQRSFDTEEI